MTERSGETEVLGDVDQRRRGFLKGASVAGAAAAVATVVPAEQAEAQQFPPEPTTRYQLSPHVERYYFLNRL